MSGQPASRKERVLADYHRRRADMDPMHRAVSDVLDEYLIRHHGITTSHTHPEDFLEWLGEYGYTIARQDATMGDGGQLSSS